MIWYNVSTGNNNIMGDVREREHNLDIKPNEVLDPNSVEVRFGDPMMDAPRLLELFTQPKTIEHLAAITPNTTEDEIRRMYRDDNIVLLTAETPSGLIVGTYSVQRPGFGSLVSEGMRLVVDEKYRNLRVAEKLVKAGNAVMFRDKEDGEFGCNKSQVYVIIGIDGEWIPQRVFSREGYLRGTENTGCTYSWSNESSKLVVRNSLPMSLYRSWYIDNRKEEHTTYFPKPRPVQTA